MDTYHATTSSASVVFNVSSLLDVFLYHWRSSLNTLDFAIASMGVDQMHWMMELSNVYLK